MHDLITLQDESCTDSEGYIKTRSHRIQLDYEDSFDNIVRNKQIH